MMSIFLLLLLSLSAFNLQSAFASADDAHVYDSFANCLTKNGIPNDEISQILYSSTNATFDAVLNAYVRNLRFNTTSTKKPAIIVAPLQARGVLAAVLCTKEAGLQLKIRSGGHDYEGISYVSDSPFVILDMFNIRNITVDLPARTAWVQTGATVGELYHSIAQQSDVLAYPAGVCLAVGIGGHISGGAYGPLLRKFGLSVDNVVDAQIVDVKGNVLDRKGMGEDLFWAIRGGGGASFGVVLAYRINLVTVPQIVTVFNVERNLSQNATDILVQWQSVANKYDENLFIRVLIQPVTSNDTSTITLKFIGLYLGDSDSLLAVVNSQLPLLGLTKSDCLEMTWIESMLFWVNFDNKTPPDALLRRTPKSVSFFKRKSDYVLTPIPKNGLTSIFLKIAQLGKVGLALNPYGGRMSRIAESDVPFPHRAGIIYKMQYMANWQDASLNQQYLDAFTELYSFMTPYVSSNPRQAFLNYRDLDIGTTTNGKDSYSEGEVYGVKYFKQNFDRLVKVKTAVDPGNFFRNEQSIPTLPDH